MDIWQVMKERHSVRTYQDKPIDKAAIEELQKMVATCNHEGGLNIQLLTDEPKCFSNLLANYGRFAKVKNYFAMVSKTGPDFEEKLGYYGEKLMLKATELGIGSCWIGLTYSKKKCAAKVGADEKLVCVISLGYADKPGKPHKTKTIQELSQVDGQMPDWFKKGMEAVQLAPTALNQQKFLFSLKGAQVLATAHQGAYTKVDLGIAKYHFELGAGIDNFSWS